MMASICGTGWRAGKEIYPDKEVIKDIKDSGVDFSQEEKANILNRSF